MDSHICQNRADMRALHHSLPTEIKPLATIGFLEVREKFRLGNSKPESTVPHPTSLVDHDASLASNAFNSFTSGLPGRSAPWWVAIEHVGSTAVPDLAAKPIVVLLYRNLR